MRIRAENDPRYTRRFLIMGVCALAFGLYCLYDGLVGYPARRVQGFAEFKDDFKTHFADSRHQNMSLEQFEVTAEDAQREDWEHYIHDRDIPSGPDVMMQFIMTAACAGIGLYLISLPLRARGRWIEASDAGITSSWGQSFAFDQVEEVDKRKWRKKGIADIKYVANNRRNTFVIDDYKFDRYPTDAILFELEQRIDPGRITNGPPEPEPESGSEVAQALENARKSAG
jgi:hypothetical protein